MVKVSRGRVQRCAESASQPYSRSDGRVVDHPRCGMVEVAHARHVVPSWSRHIDIAKLRGFDRSSYRGLCW